MNFFTLKGVSENSKSSDEIKVPLRQISAITGDLASGKSSFFVDHISFIIKKRLVALENLMSGILIKADQVPYNNQIPPMPPIVDIPGKETFPGTVADFFNLNTELLNSKKTLLCPNCSAAIKKYSSHEMVEDILSKYLNKIVSLTIRIYSDKINSKEDFKNLLTEPKIKSFNQYYIDNLFTDLSQQDFPSTKPHTIELLLDTIKINSSNRYRLTEALELGLSLVNYGLNISETERNYQRDLKKRTWYSNNHICSECGHLQDWSPEKLNNNDVKLSDFPEILNNRILNIFSVGKLNVNQSFQKLSPAIRKYLELVKLFTQPCQEETIILLKHPSSGVNEYCSQLLYEELKKLKNYHTVIVITYDPQLISRSDYVIEFKKEQLKNRIICSPNQKTCPLKENIKAKGANLQQPFNLNNVNLVKLNFLDQEKEKIIEKIYTKIQKENIKNISHVSNWLSGTNNTIIQYINIYQEIIKFLLQTNDVKVDGLTEKTFSFTKKASLICSKCRGTGIIFTDKKYRKYFSCPDCLGDKFQQQALKYKIKEKNLSSILKMSFLDIQNHFGFIPRINQTCHLIHLFSLGYLISGTAFDLLSKSEKNRLRLIKEIIRYKNSAFFIFEFPFMHFSPAASEQMINKIKKNFCPQHTFVIFDSRTLK